MEKERIRRHKSTVGKIKFPERKRNGSTIYLTAARLKSLEKELSAK